MADELTENCGDEATRNGLVEPFPVRFEKTDSIFNLPEQLSIMKFT